MLDPFKENTKILCLYIVCKIVNFNLITWRWVFNERKCLCNFIWIKFIAHIIISATKNASGLHLFLIFLHSCTLQFVNVFLKRLALLCYFFQLIKNDNVTVFKLFSVASFNLGPLYCIFLCSIRVLIYDIEETFHATGVQREKEKAPIFVFTSPQIH